MKALLKTGPSADDLEIREVPEPSPSPREVKLAVAGAGICGTDLHILRGTWRCDYPVVLGHEFCGTIVEVGSGVDHFKPGERVLAANPARTCGRCYHCLAGNDFMCAERVSAGYMIDGAFADYLVIDALRCHRLPDRVSFRQASLGEPLSVAVHATIERTHPHAGDLVLVSGPGCVGLLTSQLARLNGARVVTAGVGRDRLRLERARDLGVERTVDVEEEDLAEVVREMTDGRGADFVYECSGSPASLAACWKAVKKEGTLVPLGIYPGPIETDFNAVTMKELRVIGSYGYVWTSLDRAVRLMAEGKVKTEELITHELPLDGYAEAFRATQDGEAVKAVLNPTL